MDVHASPSGAAKSRPQARSIAQGLTPNGAGCCNGEARRQLISGEIRLVAVPTRRLRTSLLALLLLGLLFGTLLGSTARVAGARDGEAAGASTRVLYLLLVDTSSSMGGTPKGRNETKMTTVKRVLTGFLRDLPAESDVILVTFDEGIRQRWERTILSNEDREYLADLVGAMQPLGGKTWAWPSLSTLLKASRTWLQQRGRGEVRLFVYTDGDDNSGVSLDQAIGPYRDVLQSEAVRANLYTLGFTLAGGLPAELERLGVRVRPVHNMADLAPPLTADFDWSPDQPVPGAKVSFRDRSTGLIRKYAWQFGDGARSTDKAPTHAFAKPGSYKVTLEVRDVGDTTDTITRSVVVHPPEPPKVAFVAGRTTAAVGEPIPFFERCRGAVSDYRWDFGDGEEGTGAQVEHAYDKPGTYSVVLRVKDAEGATHRSAPVSITVVAPVAPTAKLHAPESTQVGEPVRLVSESEGRVEKIRWEFGDGSESTERHPIHRYEEPGTVEIRLVVTGPGGTTSSTQRLRVVPPQPPQASFTMGSASAYVQQAVNFTNTSQGVISTVSWDFGDGSPAGATQLPAGAPVAMASASHAFTKAGTYTITLKISGPGGEDKAQETIEITQEGRPPKAAFSVHPAAEHGAMTVAFDNGSKGRISGYTWDFGDGSAPHKTSARERVSHDYEIGTYTVRLTAHGADGLADDVATRTFAVEAPPGFFAKWWWAVLLGLLALGWLIKTLIQGAQERAQAFEDSLLAGSLSARDDRDGTWHHLGEVTLEERKTTATMSAGTLPASASGAQAGGFVLRRVGDDVHVDVVAGGASDDLDMGLGEGAPDVIDSFTLELGDLDAYEGQWENFTLKFKS